jgi:homocysteine S-methyltransferase
VQKPVEAIRSVIDRGRPLLLDGGLGSELDRRGFDISSPLWSAEVILQQPDALSALHRDYLDAGAQCITTASYQASVDGLRARGMSLSEIESVFRVSVELACSARDEFLQDKPDADFRPLVAASVGPPTVPSIAVTTALATNGCAIFTGSACIGSIEAPPT